MLSRVTEDYIKVDGVRLFYREEGNGTPLIFLHGGPGSNHDHFLPYLAPLSKSRKLILYDQRGCGRSDRFEDVSQYSSEHFVKELRGLIRAFGFKRVDLLGHSWGGILAQKYALRHHRTISKLILCCTTPEMLTVNKLFEAVWKSAPTQDRKLIHSIMSKKILRRGHPYPREYMMLVNRIYSGGKKNKSKIEQYTNMIFAGISWPVYHQLMGGGTFEFKIDGELKNHDVRQKLKLIKASSLVIAGKFDRFTTLALGQQLSQLLPNGVLVSFDKSGHWPFLEENKKFIRVVNNFLLD